MEKKFTIDQKQFLSVLAGLQPICTKRTTIDATTTILFQVSLKELIVKSTDLEISLQASCPLTQSSLRDTEQFLVSGKRIFEVVKELDGTIECALTDNQLTLAAGSVHMALHIKDSQEFPPFPERIENLMHLDAAFLQEMLDKVAFLIPQHNANPALNGLCIEIGPETIKMTATDGHCLAQIRSSLYTLETPRTWLLPRRAVFELKKIIEGSGDTVIFLGICNNQIVFSGAAFNFFAKVLVDTFPQYAAILQKDAFYAATVDRMRFIKTLRRSSCLLSGQFIATQFTFAPHAVKVSLHNKEVGNLEEELPVYGFEGAQLTIKFYAPYLLQGLQNFTEGTLQFFLKNTVKPIIFEAATERYAMTFLVMPVSSAHV